MRLKRLVEAVADLEVRGSKEIEISGLCSHSKQVAPGNLFIAKRGMHYEGSQFIPDAVLAGAAAVLTDLYDPFLGVTQLIHPDPQSIEPLLAARFYQNPSHKLRVIGITGTNGKSSVSYLVKHLLDQMGLKCGLIGTIEWVIGQNRFPASMTTPDLISNQKLLKEMLQEGCNAAVMEVTSHGLDQGRVEGIQFEGALFTNLTPEHLDYHKTVEAYRAAKEKLFTGLGAEGWAVMNADDSTRFQTEANVLTYGIESKADLRAEEIRLGKKKLQFTATYRGEKTLCTAPLIGRFNVYNLLGAMGVGLSMGFPLSALSSALKTAPQIPGRLERVKNRLGIHIYIDFAHTEDALKNALTTLKEITKGRVITLFGCGGDRDKEKRPRMGQVAATFSDVVFVTSDNPRSEDPEQIVREILEGIPADYPTFVELDRREAIQKALDFSEEKDCLLIAGRGHEREQIFHHQVVPFDDVEVVKALCFERGGR